MSENERCPICHEYTWLFAHKCQPVWYVGRKDDFDFVSPDAHTKVFAYDVHLAAEKAVERMNWVEPSTGHFDVIAYEEKTERFFEVRVTAEAVIQYSSNEAEQITLEDMLKQQTKAQEVLNTLPEMPENNRARYQAKQSLEFANSFIEAMKTVAYIESDGQEVKD